AAAKRALSAALSAKVIPVSSGSTNPSSPADTTRTRNGSISAASSRTLPGLWLAITSLSPVNRRATGSTLADGAALQLGELCDAVLRQLQHRVQLRAMERCALRRPLYFYDAAGAGQHEIGVRLGLGILGVFQVQDRHALIDPARNGGDRIA